MLDLTTSDRRILYRLIDEEVATTSETIQAGYYEVTEQEALLYLKQLLALRTRLKPEDIKQ